MDIKRTVLWVVFSFSLLLLWDSWMRHNGKPSMFFPSATQQAQPAAAGADPSKLPTPQVPQTAQAGGINDVPGAAVAKAETITITTDLVKADIDTVGGELKRLELLKHPDTVDPTKNLVLFDSTAGHTYLAESGLIGGAFPNHKTVFAAKPGARTLENGNEVQLVLEAQENGVKLTKTYTFKRGDYLIDLKHTVTNDSATAINPSLYLQLLRDGNKPGGESHFYSTFTGPAVYTDAEKFQKLTFEKIAEGKEQHATKSDNGWIALVQHYFVSAIIPPANAQRDIFTKKVSDNLYAVGSILPLGTVAPGASVTMDASLYSGPQVASVLEKTAPGLELVKDYGWLTIIAKPIFWLMIHIHAFVGNWGWTIILLTMLIKATRLNPTPPDPVQAKVMMFMPIAFSVMFFFFPSGLVLYWVVNNVLSITQQWVITRKLQAGKAK
eukprot:gene21091-21868_t